MGKRCWSDKKLLLEQNAKFYITSSKKKATVAYPLSLETAFRP